MRSNFCGFRSIGKDRKPVVDQNVWKQSMKTDVSRWTVILDHSDTSLAEFRSPSWPRTWDYIRVKAAQLEFHRTKREPRVQKIFGRRLQLRYRHNAATHSTSIPPNSYFLSSITLICLIFQMFLSEPLDGFRCSFLSNPKFKNFYTVFEINHANDYSHTVFWFMLWRLICSRSWSGVRVTER